MKKTIYLIFLLIIQTWVMSGQNLVINPGVEGFITCPGFGQWGPTYINNWTKPSWGSTDYYNYACPLIIPSTQSPHSGNAYFGIIAYNYGTEYREYATGELSSPLIAGKQYKVEFYVSLNDGYIQAVNELGAYISNAPPGPFSNSLHIAVTPQIENTSGALGDTAAWTLVTGIFTATGGEQYITIGNFHDDSTTTITQVGSTGSYGAYYFVDDVSVTNTIEGTDENDGESAFVSSNPSCGIFYLHAQNNSIVNGYYEVYNNMGALILSNRISTATATVNLTLHDNGIYFLRLHTPATIINYRLVKL